MLQFVTVGVWCNISGWAWEGGLGVIVTMLHLLQWVWGFFMINIDITNLLTG
jgi:hypothetical protein